MFTSHGAHRCLLIFFGGVGASPDQVVCNTCTGFECDGCLFDSVTTNWVAVRLATVPLFTVPYCTYFSSKCSLYPTVLQCAPFSSQM